MTGLFGYSLLLLVCFMITAFLVAMVRRYGQRSLLDHPNARSSHVSPTPRGGGIAFVLVGLVSLAVFAMVFEPGLRLPLTALCLGAGLLAGIGFLDDHQPVAAGWRFLCQIVAATVFLLALDGVPPLGSGWPALLPGDFWLLFYVVLIVWVTNLFNFMDGIDGIAAVEAITLFGGMGALFALEGNGSWAGLMGLLVASVTGFLVWNWAPARIFMGDVGSYFLGFLPIPLGLIALIATDMPLWPWLILLAVFITDATLTLLRRLVRGEAIYQAHRSHAYQRLSRRWDSHAQVTLAAAGINLCWLLPLAWASVQFPQLASGALVIAYLPVIVLAWCVGAGETEQVPQRH